jgi:hypothetical protein
MVKKEYVKIVCCYTNFVKHTTHLKKVEFFQSLRERRVEELIDFSDNKNGNFLISRLFAKTKNIKSFNLEI